MADMLMSANEAILATKTSVDGFGLGIFNLIASVGVLGFLGILLAMAFFGVGVGGLTLRGAARIDEYLVQPILARIDGESWNDVAETLSARNLQNITPLLSLLEEAYNLYSQGSP